MIGAKSLAFDSIHWTL